MSDGAHTLSACPRGNSALVAATGIGLPVSTDLSALANVEELELVTGMRAISRH